MPADVSEMLIERQDGAFVILSDHRNITVGQANILALFLQFVRQLPSSEPCLIRLVEDGECIHELLNDYKLLFGFRSLEQFRQDDPRDAYLPVLCDCPHIVYKPRGLAPKILYPHRGVDQDTLSAHGAGFRLP